MPASPLLNMSPITIGGSYKDPRANVLYGGGNSKISDKEIASYVTNARNSGTMSEKDLVDKAIANGISIDQFARATGMNINDVTKAAGQYVSSDRDGPSVTLDMAQILSPIMSEIQGIKADKVKPTNVALNPTTDTVQGQLGSILQDPNNPLMVRASTMGEQAANRRGLLNSSIGVSAGQSALTDAALQIATPDANTFSQSKFANAQAANNASLANAQNSLTARMFNNDMDFKVGSLNAQNQLDATKFNAQNINAVVSQTLSQFMDNENRVKLANIEAAAQGKSNLTNLYNNIASQLIDVWKSDSPNKQQITDNAMTLFNNALALDKAGDNLGLDKLSLSTRETPAGGNALLNSATGNQSGREASMITKQPLGQNTANPNLFETIGGTISATAANRLKDYGVDARFVIGSTPLQVLARAYAGDTSNAALMFDPAIMRNINSTELNKRLKEGLQSGVIKEVTVRDPATGFPFDPALADFDDSIVYYDPNNTLGLIG